MKINWKLLLTGFSAAMILTACGTDSGNDNEKSNGSSGVVDETETNVDETNDTDLSLEDENEDEGQEQENVQSDMDKAALQDSDAQDYALYVLPEYTLTSEEPGRDSLYFGDDGEYFMRIETQLSADGDYEYLLENMQETLKASADTGELTEVTDEEKLPSAEGIERVKAFTVQSEDSPITGIVFEQGDLLIRLTIFDSPEAEHYNDFIQMGETIQKK